MWEKGHALYTLLKMGSERFVSICLTPDEHAESSTGVPMIWRASARLARLQVGLVLRYSSYTKVPQVTLSARDDFERRFASHL